MIIHVDYAAYAKLILDTVCAVIDGKDMPKVQTLDTTLSVKDYYACVSTRCIVI